MVTDTVVDSVAPGTAAAQAGLQPGDQFLSVDFKPLTRRDELREHFNDDESDDEGGDE